MILLVKEKDEKIQRMKEKQKMCIHDDFFRKMRVFVQKIFAF